jgi:hypothetical protein
MAERGCGVAIPALFPHCLLAEALFLFLDKSSATGLVSAQDVSEFTSRHYSLANLVSAPPQPFVVVALFISWSFLPPLERQLYRTPE